MAETKCLGPRSLGSEMTRGRSGSRVEVSVILVPYFYCGKGDH